MGRSRTGNGVRSPELRTCDACGHAGQLHSNEACEAIRCTCRVTQKMLAAALVREPLPAVARVRRSPANAKPKKKRRSPAERDGTQAA